MGERNEVRVSDQDPEMLAIKAVSAALAPLERQAAKRVLQWADARYGFEASALGNERASATEREFFQNMTRGFEACNVAARNLGVSGGALIGVLERVYRDAAKEVESVAGSVA